MGEDNQMNPTDMLKADHEIQQNIRDLIYSAGLLRNEI